MVCIATAVGCARTSADALDAVAREYVELARAVDAHEPSVLARIVDARQRVRDAGRAEALPHRTWWNVKRVRDAGRAEALPHTTSRNVSGSRTAVRDEDERRAFLVAQLGALERRARFLAGSRTSIRDEAAALGLRVPTYDAARAAAFRSELDRALPGDEPLAARLLAHRRAHAVSRAALDRVATDAVDSCRALTPALDAPADHGVELRYVIERPWPAFTSYRGDGRSLVEMRRDAAWLRDDLFAVLCHETYPGHHTQHLVWDDLRRSRGWAEFAVAPPFTPHGVMAERAAIAAVSLLVPRTSRPAVSRILDDMAPLAAATAVAAVDGEMLRSAAIARLRDELMMPDAEGFLAFVEQQRSMALAYVSPAPGVHDWRTYLALLRSPEALVAGAAQ